MAGLDILDSAVHDVHWVVSYSVVQNQFHVTSRRFALGHRRGLSASS